MSPRRRWRYNEETGETIEETPPDPESDEHELAEAQRKHEQAERDAHPGTYL